VEVGTVEVGFGGGEGERDLGRRFEVGAGDFR
jgi:hypothetical protein